ncbi:MAG: thioredoxin-dependent thiol peroxidase [Actinobacteria bacterium]|uniref:thioredoxin-dependent peroxiredoxin n=1 Tax=freshwater metagenome TaxID=449393 RepID=A0A6J6X0M8_9ZZZZ|nr:thioredoxin-dependent thiol peroxidase [Actinomycetota bacterium]
MAKLEVGKKAPAFTLINQDGAKVSLKDFAGQRVVLYFYPADDTPGCTTEACQFNDELKAFAKLDTVVLGVSPNNEASHIKFREKYGLKFNLLCDPDKKTMEKYGAYGEKILYGKTVIGVIRSTFIIGPTGTIERTWYSVKTNGHAAKVLEALQG